MSYEQCIEHIVIADSAMDWLTWAKIMVPTVSSLASVGGVYWLTTRRERNQLEEHKQKAKRVDSAGWLQLSALVREANTTDTIEKYRELQAKAKGICEYFEVATEDVYRHTNIRAFNRFAHLKRIAYHFRDVLKESGPRALEALTQDDATPGALQALAADVERRMDGYAQLYGTEADGHENELPLGMD